MTRSKDKGTAAETAVVRYLRTVGWPGAERRALAGAHDRGDITGTPGICWEIKARARLPGDAQIDTWMAETEAERANAVAEFGVLVVDRSGYGAARAGSWWAYLPVNDAAALVAFAAQRLRPTPPPLGPRGRVAPARLLLSDTVALLHAAGYGTRPEVAP